MSPRGEHAASSRHGARLQSEGQRLNKLIPEKNVDGFPPRSVGEYMNAAEDLASEAEAAPRKARKYTDAAGGKPSASRAGTKRRQQASSYKQKCPGCGIFNHVHQECFYRNHPYFNKDPTIEYAQSPIGIRYFNKYGGRYIKERDMDSTMHKNDRGASMLRKHSRQEEFAGLSGKSLGSKRSVLRSREPSQHSRGDSFVRADTSVYFLAHQRDRRIDESNSDSRRKEFYDRRREAESSRDQCQRSGSQQGLRQRQGSGSAQGNCPRHQIVAATPERKWTIIRSARGIRGTRRTVKTQGKGAATSLLIQRGIDQATVSVLKLMMILPMYAPFFDAAPVANEADRVEDRLLSASIPHPSRNPRIPSLHVDVLPDTGSWSAHYINEATAAWLRSVARNVVLRCVVV